MENYKKLPSMGFAESVKSVLSNLLNFNGRARRSELWWYWVAYAVIAIIVVSLFSGFPMLSGIIGTFLQMSLWAVTVRRLHDRGHSGWWVAVAILTSVFIQFYIAGSGYYEAMSAVNPDIDAAMASLRGPVFPIAGLVSFIVNITIFIFCVLDGKPEPNKYGPSPKYVQPDDYYDMLSSKNEVQQ